MSLFPLYDEIVSKMTGQETTLSQNQCTTITKLDQNHLEIIYLLILHHFSATTGSGSKTDIPYGGKTISNGKGITFRRLSQLPDDLQKTLSCYLTLITEKS